MTLENLIHHFFGYRRLEGQDIASPKATPTSIGNVSMLPVTSTILTIGLAFASGMVFIHGVDGVDLARHQGVGAGNIIVNGNGFDFIGTAVSAM